MFDLVRAHSNLTCFQPLFVRSPTITNYQVIKCETILNVTNLGAIAVRFACFSIWLQYVVIRTLAHSSGAV